ncbi:MAG: hypothetical protein JNJ40_15900 [Bacteroidia bacterium]|nr:hypothetical protein [Bacteroidia bacterium]
MKKHTILFLLVIVNAAFVFTDCTQKDPTDPRNAGLHQEILPKGRKSDIDTNSTLTIGQQDSISRNP